MLWAGDAPEWSRPPPARGSQEPLFSSLSPLPRSSPQVGHAPPAPLTLPYLNTISQRQNTVPDILGVFPTVLLPGAGGAGLVVL